MCSSSWLLPKTGTPNAIVARGQTIKLPAGRYNRVYLLAASADGDQNATFLIGDRRIGLNIQDWSGFIGQWDTRQWKQQPERDWAISANHAAWPPADLQQREQRPVSPRYPEDYVGLQPGYVKTAELAWYASHQHTAEGLNQPYQYSYLFAYPIALSGGERTLTLPDNDKSVSSQSLPRRRLRNCILHNPFTTRSTKPSLLGLRRVRLDEDNFSIDQIVLRPFEQNHIFSQNVLAVGDPKTLKI